VLLRIELVPITAVQGLAAKGTRLWNRSDGLRIPPSRFRLQGFHRITPGGAGHKTFFVAMLLAARTAAHGCYRRPQRLAAVTLIRWLWAMGLRRNWLRRPGSLRLAALVVRGSGLKLLVDARTDGEGAAEAGSKEPRAGEQGEDRQIDGQLGSVREELRAGVPRRLGIRHPVATIALRPPHRPSASPACWPAPLGRPGLVTGLAVGPAKVDRPADSEAAALSPQRWPVSLLRPHFHRGRPWLDFWASARGVVEQRLAGPFPQGAAQRSRGVRGAFEAATGIADLPVLIHQREFLRLALAPHLQGHRGRFHSGHCIAGNGGAPAAQEAGVPT